MHDGWHNTIVNAFAVRNFENPRPPSKRMEILKISSSVFR